VNKRCAWPFNFYDGFPKSTEHLPCFLPVTAKLFGLIMLVAYFCRDFLALPFLAPEGRDFPTVSVVSGRDFPAVAFLAWVIKKNSMAAGKLFWYLQRDFLSLIRKFSGGKLKQNGFFHSVMIKIDWLAAGV
jgi:hypothetical protein